MKVFALLLAAAGLLAAQPRIDNVLVKMVPPGTTSLVGAHMDQIRTTVFYNRLLEQQKLPQVDEFAKDTGFDPRRDVRELLFATTPDGGVLLARGTFKLSRSAVPDAKIVRHGQYVIQSRDGSGYCILDTTLAAAGDLKALEAALDEWKSGSHTAAQPLLTQAKPVDPQSQFWGISTGMAGFLAEHMPKAGSGLDFSRIFKGLEDTWFEASFTTGFKGEMHGTTASEPDAVNLRDAAKGLVGFGRLSVPENQPEMLKLWDGITVDQQARSIAIRADIPQNLVDRLVRLLNSAQQGRGGRGRAL